jgi:hypothetical protein
VNEQAVLRTIIPMMIAVRPQRSESQPPALAAMIPMTWKRAVRLAPMPAERLRSRP